MCLEFTISDAWKALSRLFLVNIFCLAIIVSGNCWAAGYGSITIGALLDLSGPGSINGEAAYKAARLALEDINLQGGIRGHRLQLSVFDTRGQKELLISGARRLQREQHARLLLGPTNRNNVSSLKDYAEANKIPLILIQGLDPLLSFRNKQARWTFSTTLNFDAELKALFSYFRKKHYETLGVLLFNSPKLRKVGLWLKGYTPEYGLRVSCIQVFNPYQDDLAMKLEYISRCDPDIAILWANWQEAALVQGNLKNSDVPMAISHQLFFNDPKTIALPLSSLIYVAVPPVLCPQSIPRSSQAYFMARRFADSWGADYEGMAPEQKLVAGQAWDGLRLACRAISLATTLSHEAIRSSLEEKIGPFIGVTGTYHPEKRDHSGLRHDSLLILRCMGAKWSAVTR